MTTANTLIIIVGAAILIVVAIRMVRIRELREVARFKSRDGTDEKEFLRQLDLEPGTADADFARDIRAAMARLGEIPPEKLLADHKFYPDLQKLPFYDSIDAIELIMILENVLKIPITDVEAESIVDYKELGDMTVAEFILHALAWYHSRSGEQIRK